MDLSFFCQRFSPNLSRIRDRIGTFRDLESETIATKGLKAEHVVSERLKAEVVLFYLLNHLKPPKSAWKSPKATWNPPENRLKPPGPDKLVLASENRSLVEHYFLSDTACICYRWFCKTCKDVIMELSKHWLRTEWRNPSEHLLPMVLQDV